MEIKPHGLIHMYRYTYVSVAVFAQDRAQSMAEYFDLDDVPADDGPADDGPADDGPAEDYFDLGDDGVPAQEADYFDLDDRAAEIPIGVPVAPRVRDGFRWRGKAWMERLREIKPCSRAKAKELAGRFSQLADGFDTFIRRHGDKADRSVLSHEPREQQCAHANTTTVGGLIRGAFEELGKGSVARAGEVAVDGGRRKLESLLSVASMVRRLFRRGSAQLYTRLYNAVAESEMSRGIVIERHFDSTPVFLRFGSLQGEVSQKARYLQLVTEEVHVAGNSYERQRWKAIPYEEYRKLHPKASCHSGVVEVLGKTIDISNVTFCDSDAGNWEDTYNVSKTRLILPPSIVESTSGSCTLRAMQLADPSWSYDRVHNLARRNRLVCLSDMCDGGSGMTRLKHATALKFSDNPYVLYDEYSSCFGHILHNDIARLLKEDEIVGHAHAVTVVLNLNQRRDQLLGALRHLVRSELVCFDGPPPPEYSEHIEAVIHDTLLRSAEIVRARQERHDFDGDDEEYMTVLKEQIKHVPHFANGNICLPVVSHYENGCCTDSDGVTSKEIQIENMVAALSVLIMWPWSLVRPAKNRWLSVGQVLAMITCGFMFYSILPRCWRLAFGEANVPESLGGAVDDFHKYVRSKIRRVSLWFQSESTEERCPIYSILSAPAEHLLMVLQKDDSGIFRDIFSPSTNPFFLCLEQYARMLTQPKEYMPSLVRHFAQKGVHTAWALMRVVFSFAISLMSAIWRDLSQVALAWPNKLFGMVCGLAAVMQETAEQLYTASLCCLDKALSQKVRDLCPDAASLLKDASAMSVIRALSSYKRATNLNLERLLKMFRAASPDKCQISRYVSAGFLAQVQHEHLKAGGSDVRKVTRRQLRSMSVPIKARQKAKRTQHSLWDVKSFASWANPQLAAKKKMTRTEYREAMRDLKEQWQADDVAVLPRDLDDEHVGGQAYEDMTCF